MSFIEVPRSDVNKDEYRNTRIYFPGDRRVAQDELFQFMDDRTGAATVPIFAIGGNISLPAIGFGFQRHKEFRKYISDYFDMPISYIGHGDIRFIDAKLVEIVGLNPENAEMDLFMRNIVRMFSPEVVSIPPITRCTLVKEHPVFKQLGSDKLTAEVDLERKINRLIDIQFAPEGTSVIAKISRGSILRPAHKTYTLSDLGLDNEYILMKVINGMLYAERQLDPKFRIDNWIDFIS